MIIAVSGNIGAGKTTLVKRLSHALNYRAEYEAIDQNPYLEQFYYDMKRWSFPLQVYFLSHRFRQGMNLNHDGQGVVLDRTIYEDAWVFAQNLHRSGHMSDKDYKTYLHLYEGMVKLVPAPDLLIYLQASPKLLAGRIKTRGKSGDRTFEESIPTAYLRDLNHFYEEWIGQYSDSEIYTIDIDQIDLAQESEFKKLLETVQHYQDA